MAWTVALDDAFARADTAAGGAGSTTGVGNGWVDAAGGTWNLSGGKLVGATSAAAAYLSRFLKRPAGEAAVASRIAAAAYGSFTGAVGLGLRQQASGDYYLAEFSCTGNNAYQVLLYKITGGNPAALTAPQAFSATLSPTGTYLVDFSATGGNPTTLALTVTNVATSAVLVSAGATDGAASLQGAGTPLLVTYVAGRDSAPVSASYARVTTYTQSAGATMAASPSSVTGGTANQVVNLAGTGTAFSGSPFTLSGGLGARLLSQSAGSGAAGTVTLNPGLAGNGPLTVTDSGSGATAAVAVAVPSLGPLNLGWIGDSITQGTNGDPVGAATAYLQGLGYAAASTNRGVSGTSSQDWLPGGAYLPAAITAMQSAGVTLVHILLGANDQRTPNNLTPPQHAANMRAIVPAVRAAGMQVVVSKPIYTVPNAVLNVTSIWPNDPAGWYEAAWRLNATLADGVGVFLGDTAGHAASALSPATFLADGVHPRDAAANITLGQYWARAVLGRYGAAAGSVANRWAR